MYHSVTRRSDVMSPKEFRNLGYEQRELQDNFLHEAGKRINTCLLEIAGGETPSPYYGRFKHYPKDVEEYTKFLNDTYAVDKFKLKPGLIHIEVCPVTCVAPPHLFENLRQKMICAGWGEATYVHQRACSDMVWVSLEPVFEEETYPDVPADFHPNGKTDSELHTASVKYGLMPHESEARKLDRQELIAAFKTLKQQQEDARNTDDEPEDDEDENQDDIDYPTDSEIDVMSIDSLMDWCNRLGMSVTRANNKVVTVGRKSGVNLHLALPNLRKELKQRIADLKAKEEFEE